jgi:glycerol-3-phosphate acyltransferase PlsY
MAGTLAIIVGYFLGGLPIGVLVARSRGVDLFKVGSGNVGTTNVVRAVGLKYGLLTWVGDVGKGLVAALIAKLLGQPETIVAAAGAAAVMGHCYSPYLRLRGGRGVATSLGVLLVCDWRVGLVAFGLWAIVMIASRMVSLASLIAAAALVPLAAVFHPTSAMFVLSGLLTCNGFIRHKPNLERLLQSEERRFGSKKGEGER